MPTGALSVPTAAAVTAALAAVPAHRRHRHERRRPTHRAGVRPHGRRARTWSRCVTGDRVVLRHDGQGHTSASLTLRLAALRPPGRVRDRGDPHLGGPQARAARCAAASTPRSSTSPRWRRARPRPTEGHLRDRAPHRVPCPACTCGPRPRAAPPAGAPRPPRRTTPRRPLPASLATSLRASPASRCAVPRLRRQARPGVRAPHADDQRHDAEGHPAARRGRLRHERSTTPDSSAPSAAIIDGQWKVSVPERQLPDHRRRLQPRRW